MSRKKEDELKRLVLQINQWNIDHFDLFELSQPNEDLEFHGVIRFYFQDEGQKVSTKCVRVASTACTQEVVDVLVEKFRPDMRMLTPTSYSLYEVHVTGEERKMMTKEKPLLIQLNWGKDVREGRFLLKRDTEDTIPKEQEFFELEGEMKGFKRKLSKREKKEKKKREKDRIRNKENFGQSGEPGDHSVAEKHYNELPETSFTRSISNPEAVMRRRRQQKLEKKLEQIRNQGPNSAGTLKIYGESLNPDVPYKTLLLSSSDPVWYVIKETLEKYGMEKEVPKEYILVQVSIPYDEREYHGGKIGEERRLDLDECPLAIAMQHPPSKGTLLFQIRKKSVDEKKKAKKLRAVSHEELRYNPEQSPKSAEKLPFLLELLPDGSENPRGRRHRLQFDVTEVGSDQNVLNSGQSLVIPDRSIQPRHCVIAHTEGGIVTVTPTSREAEIYVNNHRIYETTILKEGMTVAFGRNNVYRFVHPMEQEKQQKAQFAEDIAALKISASPERMPPHQQQVPGNFNETTFDLDGHVETHSGEQFGKPLEKEAMQNRSPPQMDMRGPEQLGKLEDALPVALEFREDAEDHLLGALISDVNGVNASFKLAPTYTVYMGIRYRLSMMYRPDMSPTERAHRLTSFINKVASLAQQTIQDQHDNPSAMSFWMANASELLHFCKQDHDVHPFSQDAQEVLAESVQIAFHHLVQCLQQDLQGVMMAFLDENEDKDEDDFMNGDTLTRRYKGRPVLSDVLNTLSSAMHLLRRCRVNAALTIQLFSQLFHFINMSLFNTLVTQPQMRLCTMKWGIRLKRRLGRVEAWAEKQGLELAADCHLCRIIQAAHLLQAPKSSPDHIAYISSTCFKLNSLQLRVLLEKYIPEPNEPPIPQTLIEKVVAVAENMADELTRTDGRDIQLEEDPDLQLPFLLPEDGYSCDIIRGVPNGLLEFLEPLSRSGLCRTMVQQAAVGEWTVYMVPGDENKFTEQNVRAKGVNQPPAPANTDLRPAGPSLHGLPKEPEILRVTFSKVNGSMGLSIVAARGESEKESGIYIKSVVPQGAAALDGRLTAGDQLLEVDGRSLVGLSQEKAAELMTRTGQTVSLKVAKQGAIYHGLAKLLSQPSPIMQQRGVPRGQTSLGQPHTSPPRHEEAPPPYYNDPQENGPMQPGNKPGDSRHLEREPGMVEGKFRPGLQQSQLARSSPSLNSDISNSERQRATSTSNIRDDGGMGPRQAPPNAQPYKQPGLHEIDSRSKSTSNLHGQPDMYGRHEPHNQPIRAAASTSVLPRNQHPARNEQPPMDQRGYDPRTAAMNDPQHYNGGPNNDYVNQPYGDPRQHPNSRGQPQGSPNYSRRSNDSRGSGDPNKWSPPQQGVPPPTNKRTSSSSSSSLREENRPRSAYIPQSERPEYPHARPKSEEIEAARVREWQERNERSNYNPQLSPNAHPSERPNTVYNNARSGQPGSAPNTGGRLDQDIPRSTVNNQQKQAGFYANTTPRPQDATPPFHQLPVHPELQERDKPQTKAKPGTATKPGAPKVQHMEVTRSQVPTWKNPASAPKVSHVEIPRQSIDNRNTQPQFFEQKSRPNDQRLYSSSNHPDQRLNSSSNRPDQRLNSSSNHPDQRLNSSSNHPDPRLNSNSNHPDQRLDSSSNHPDQRINAHQDSRSNLNNRQDSRSNMHSPPDPRSNSYPHQDPRSNSNIHQDPRSNNIDPHDPRHQQNAQHSSYTAQATPNTPQSQYAQSHQMSYDQQPAPNNHTRHPAARDVYGQPQEFPPPPEVPPELPPPPEDAEELPPPPPPPSQEYRLEQHMREEQERLLQQLNNQFEGPEGYRDPYASSSQGYPDNSYSQDRYDPQRLPHVDPYSSQPNYQNINRFQKDGQDPRLTGHGDQKPHESRGAAPQSNLHNRYEQPYEPQDPRQAPQQEQVNRNNDLHSYRKPPITSKPKNAKLKANQLDKDKIAVSPSPWEREEKEKEEKDHQTSMKQMREQEIVDLEQRLPYLSPAEHDRLKKLRLEQEFQRRVEEVDQQGEEDDDSDHEVNDRVPEREQLIQTVKDDLLKAKLRLEQLSQRHMYDDYDKEKERMERLQRKLEMFEKEREEQRARQKKRQEMRERKQNEYLLGQREMREKQRREFEENKRLLMQEEEKMHQRKMEEIKRKKEMEKEQLREMQATRDAEEAALRAEVKKQEEEYSRQRMAQQEKERQEQQREIRVHEERKRLEMLAQQQNQVPAPYQPPYDGNQVKGYQLQQYNHYGYQQPPHLAQPPQLNNHQHQAMDSANDRGMLNAPPPPERKSSYEYVHQHQQSFRGTDYPVDQNNYMNSAAYRGGPPGSVSSLRNNPEGNNVGPPVAKKSVSFNSQLETQINTYSVSSEDDRSQHPSYSSYHSSGSSQDPPSPNDGRYPDYGANPATPITPGPNEVFQTPPQNSAPNVSYKVTDTPGVVGAQEVYRDPRSRIQAKKAQIGPLKGTGTERMSFRDKMKFFAQEAGENTPVERPKASRIQRTIESQIMNGQ